jgi:hypothetical protein
MSSNVRHRALSLPICYAAAWTVVALLLSLRIAPLRSLHGLTDNPAVGSFMLCVFGCTLLLSHAILLVTTAVLAIRAGAQKNHRFALVHAAAVVITVLTFVPIGGTSGPVVLLILAVTVLCMYFGLWSFLQQYGQKETFLWLIGPAAYIAVLGLLLLVSVYCRLLPSGAILMPKSFEALPHLIAPIIAAHYIWLLWRQWKGKELPKVWSVT